VLLHTQHKVGGAVVLLKNCGDGEEGMKWGLMKELISCYPLRFVYSPPP
jgi:hypothetical protein